MNCNIATACFELLCNAHSLGTTIMSYTAKALNELAPCCIGLVFRYIILFATQFIHNFGIELYPFTGIYMR